MNKYLSLLFCVSVMMSCSRTMYYVYDEDGSRKGYPEGYCTFEVNVRKGVYYRAHSSVYSNDYLYPYGPQFIFISGNASS